MDIYQYIDNNINNIILFSGITIIVIILLMFIIIYMLIRQNKKYKKFIKGSNAESLENIILENKKKLDIMNNEIKDINIIQNKHKEQLITTFQKMGVKKYDAFKEMGGKLSFAIALLNMEDSGFLINSVHSTREGCYIFVKEIIKGESFIELSKDEIEALDIAKNQI